MSQRKRKPEILAPAGSMECLKAAVAAGCDAVYMGGSRFGARAYADNPTEEGMVQAIEYCHLYGVKLYMTINTLLKDAEIQKELYDFLLPCYKAGVDAVIVQDMGVLRMLHTWFPDLPLHASTQMGLTMGRGMKYLQRYGVPRIVPARELSLTELERMRQDTDAEIEVFVHGALCYCYSGKCLFSSMQGGRSGNRGRCAGPCRMQYQGAGRPGYYFSLKELCNLPLLAELIQTGIDSLKIEGRMKQPEYVALVTAMYRKYVDLCFALGPEGFRAWKQDHGLEWKEDLRKLSELYNREGFTQGYLEGRAGGQPPKKGETGSMLSMKRPRHGGVRVGTVLSVDGHSAVFHLERDIMYQDVVEFRDCREQTIYEYTVGEPGHSGQDVRARFQKGCKIRAGDAVYRTRHQCLLEEIREQYLPQKPAGGGTAKLPIRGCFFAQAGLRCRLTLAQKDERITVEGDVVFAPEKQPASEESVRRVLSQTGDSSFVFEDLSIKLSGEVFLPVGMLKKLRREALQALERQIVSRSYRQKFSDSCAEERKRSLSGTKEQEGILLERDRQQGSRCKETETSVSVMKQEQLEAVLEHSGIAEVIIRMDCLEDGAVMEGIRLIQETGKRAVVGLPYVWREAVWQRYEKEYRDGRGIFAEITPDAWQIHNLESFAFLQDVAGIEAERIITDADLYVMNEEACLWWQEQGVQCMTAPLELTGEECGALSCRDLLQFVVYGHIPLMISAQCTAYNTSHCRRAGKGRNGLLHIQDDKKRVFLPLNCCKYCYNIIYQGRPYYVPEQRETLLSFGYQALRYDFTIESREQVDSILAGHAPEEYEKGHYERGIW